MKAEVLLILLISRTLSAYTIKKLTCECTEYATETFFYPNYTCSHHKYNSKASSYVTGHFYSRKPITEHWVYGVLEAKINDRFIKIFEFDKEEVCSQIRTIGPYTHRLFVACYKAAKESMPGFIHPCPYDGIHAVNFTMNKKLVPSFLVTGEFKSSFKTFATENEDTHLCTIKSEFIMNED